MTETGTAPTKGLRQFGRDFWVINGIELFERGAYYTQAPLLAVFMLAIGVSAATAGIVASVLFALLYFIPLLSAPVSEKIGYKKALAICFVLLSAGYATIAFTTSTATFVPPTAGVPDFGQASSQSLAQGASMGLMWLGVVLVGLGAGIFKPIAAAVVAQSTTTAQRNFAFQIYYAGINLGAFLFPLGAGLAALLAPNYLLRISLLTAAALSLLNLALVFLVFRNLREPDRDKNVLQQFKALGDVLKDRKFLVLLVIYSGFWFMYAMSLTFIYPYAAEFGRTPAWLNTALLATINPLVIILVAPLLGGLTSRVNNLVLMVGGIALYAVGFIVVGFTNASLLFVTGILLFSIGELLTHPSYLAYVTKISPPDRVSVYLGYGFIPVGVGLFFGSSVGGALYGSIAQAGRPSLFWAIMAAAGLVTIAALLVYNRAIAPKAPAAPDAPVATRRSSLAPYGAAALALLLVPALVFAGSAMPSREGAITTQSVGLGGVTDWVLSTLDGSAAEGETVVEEIVLPAGTTGTAAFNLTWTDEAPSGPGAQNAPDTFKVSVTLPDGTVVASEAVANAQGAAGFISVVVENAVEGTYKVAIEAVSCGDTTIRVGGVLDLPAGQQADTGNAFELAVAYAAPAEADGAAA